MGYGDDIRQSPSLMREARATYWNGEDMRDGIIGTSGALLFFGIVGGIAYMLTGGHVPPLAAALTIAGAVGAGGAFVFLFGKRDVQE